MASLQSLITDFMGRYSVVGLSGCQGCGKTTITSKLNDIVLSVDDFYFPFQKLQEIKSTNNPFYKHRGLPGTHDVELLKYSLDMLIYNNNIQVPIFDKSLHNGKGDRSGMRIISKREGQRIVIEGWFVGFLPTEIPLQPWFSKSNVDQINLQLSEYVPIWTKMDAVVHIKTMDTDNIIDWRYEQEVSRNQGMSRTEIEDFVSVYLPWYQCRMILKPTLLIILDKNRRVVHHEVINC